MLGVLIRGREMRMSRMGTKKRLIHRRRGSTPDSVRRTRTERRGGCRSETHHLRMGVRCGSAHAVMCGARAFRSVVMMLMAGLCAGDRGSLGAAWHGMLVESVHGVRSRRTWCPLQAMARMLCGILAHALHGLTLRAICCPSCPRRVLVGNARGQPRRRRDWGGGFVRTHRVRGGRGRACRRLGMLLPLPRHGCCVSHLREGRKGGHARCKCSYLWPVSI